MILYPNAKINIGLNVLDRRKDGYHNISSIFYPVRSLFDVLEVIHSDIFSFTSTGLTIPEGENICCRAFSLLKKDFDISNVKIHLHKQIPIGAGVGGGSSDGAFTLIALNKLFNLELSNEKLKRYALNLGADCPFFIDNKPSYVTGLGEKINKINLDLSEYYFKFNFPDIHISTKQAYSGIIPVIPKRNILELINSPLEDWRQNIINDFEEYTFKKYPKLRIIKQNMYSDGAIYVSMSGSGSVIFGIFKD